MHTEILTKNAARKAMFCVAIAVLVGGSGCFNSSDTAKLCMDDSGCTSPSRCVKATNESRGKCLTGSAGASGSGGSAHGSGGSNAPGGSIGSNGSGGSNGNDASVIDSPMDTGGSDPIACKMDAECSTGHCVDGLCCDTECDGQCESCKQPDSLGICKAVKGVPDTLDASFKIRLGVMSK